MHIRQASGLSPETLYFVSLAIFYFIVFLRPELSFTLHLVLILWSYYLIIVKGQFIPVVALILYSRAFVGFSTDGGPIGYTELNILTNYLPALIYILAGKKNHQEQSAIYKYPWTFAYGLILLVYSLLIEANPMQVLGDRLLPFLFILFFLFKIPNEPRFRHDFLRLMRYLVVATLIVSALPNYLELAHQYLKTGIVFGTESASSIYLGSIPRVMGPLWDPRLFGTVCALYLAVFLSIQESQKSRFDAILALAGVSLSLSRGAIVLTVLIIIFYFFIKDSEERNTKKLLAIFVTIPSILFIVSIFGDNVFIVNNVNPFEQRSDFFWYAINRFVENPLGSGVGSMRDIPGGVAVLDAKYFAVTDAYLSILLAEIGFLGFVIFLLSFRELIWGKGLLSKALFIGLLIQMLGTDVGDFGMYYFAIVTVCIALRAETNVRSRQTDDDIVRNGNYASG